MFKSTKILTLSSLCFIMFLFSIEVSGQIGEGGTTSPFTDVGFGARALSLGGAFVALADDPTAIYWNPGALDFMQKKSAGFFYSSQGFGTSSNFIGGVWPTLDFGTIGIGWARIGTDNVSYYDNGGNPLGDPRDFGQDQIFFSYGKQLKDALGVGGSFKIERMIFQFNDLSGTRVGFDLGVKYKPNFDNMFLQNVAFGFNIQNAIASSMQLQQEDEAAPINFKVGLDKPIPIGAQGNVLHLVLDVNKGKNSASTFHIGTEYSFQDNAGLRVGLNGGQIALGAGATYKEMRIDYIFGKSFDGPDFGSSHKFSFSIDFGKSKVQRRAELRAAREQEIELRLHDELWLSKKLEFNNFLSNGKNSFANDEYREAYVQFKGARTVADTMEVMSRGYIRDEGGENRMQTATAAQDTASSWLAMTDRQWAQEREEEKRRIFEEERKRQRSEAISELNNFIIEHRDKGDEFFKNGFYAEAINEWQLVATRISDSNVEDLPDEFLNIRKHADENIESARKQIAAEQQRREQRIQRLSFDDHFNRGVTYYARKDWKEAAEAFQRALEIRRNHAEAQEYYDRAYARSVATVQQMTQAQLTKYARSVSLYRDGKYHEALKLLEEIRKEQPYNKRVLDRIDLTEEKLQK